MYFRPKRSPKDLRSEFLLPPKRETETNETGSPEWKVQICASSKSKVARHTGHRRISKILK
jgi:hypothetical protein